MPNAALMLQSLSTDPGGSGSSLGQASDITCDNTFCMQGLQVALCLATFVYKASTADHVQTLRGRA